MKKLFPAVCATLALWSGCTKSDEIAAPQDENIIDSIPVITAILSEDTRTSFDYSEYRLLANWSRGDKISITPNGYMLYQSGLYTLSGDGGSSADFTLETAVGTSASSYYAFYPGDRVSSYNGLTRFSFDGQVQKKESPMAHLSDYFVMYKIVSDYSVIDFSDAVKSSCMRLDLSGMTFSNPSKIELRIQGSGNFYTNCTNNLSRWSYYHGDEPISLKESKVLELELEGYGSETRLIAWLAMSNKNVQLSSGDIVRVKVFTDDGVWYSDTKLSSAMTLTAGNCHRLTVDSGWQKSSADYTQYSFDGEVVALQEAGRNLDLVIMGDGFVAEDFDGGDSSTYMSIMKTAAEQFFKTEPYVYLRDFFNVYIVKAVSPERTNAETTGTNGARNTGTETKFSVRFTPNSTSTSGDNDTVFEYAAKALSGASSDKRFNNMTVIVIANQACRAGTCWNFLSASDSDYAISNAIAYFGLGKSVEEGYQLVRHEASGHGFGKLADEYSYSSYRFSNTAQWNSLRQQQACGMFKNVDCYVSPSIQSSLGTSYALTTKDNVLWSDLFGTSNNYESDDVEALGVYEGGNVYSTGFCRPTQDGSKSIMNQNTGIFNAISRRLILHRANCLMGTNAGVFGSAEELAWFLDWDRTYMLPHMGEYLKAGGSPRRSLSPEPPELPFAPPVNKFGHFEGTKFVED